MKPVVPLSIVASLMAAVGSPAARALPADRTILYQIHETPTNPESPVVFKIELEISAVMADPEEDTIGWEVTEAVFTIVDTGGDIVWSIAEPDVDTPDGLWWVEHADVTKPVQSEFVLAPPLAGTADPDDPQDDDLLYDFVGAEFQGTPPYQTTGAMYYTFAMAADPEEPVEDGDPREPVDVPDHTY